MSGLTRPAPAPAAAAATTGGLGDRRGTVRPAAVLELLKPLTWFAPIWALGCGIVSAHVDPFEGFSPLLILGGVVLAGPLTCGTSQAINDWFDRHVDAINEPARPIPSGRLPGRSGLAIACAGTVLGLGLAAVLGTPVLLLAAIGMALAWAYSAPPVRLKRNGWFGNLAVGVSYEGLPWLAGDALMRHALPGPHLILVAACYSLGAHGIMVLNDFKSIEGDRAMGLRSLPARLGSRVACRIACVTMAAAQVAVIALLAWWGAPVHAAIVGAVLAAQVALMPRLLADPRGRAPWYNASGTTLYVLGMLTAATCL